jgi:glycosyltransferase involved in cell wall biosynthesis
MVDVIVTTRNRKEMLERTVESFEAMNRKIPYRMFIVDDASDDGTPEYLGRLNGRVCFTVFSKIRGGVVFGFNLLWNMVEYHDMFHEEYPYLCYLQDDAESMEEEWILTAIRAYEEFGGAHNVGFFSGYDAPEHPAQARIRWRDREVAIKLSQGATNLIAEKRFWRSIGYVPRNNPDGTPRGFPDRLKGSHIDLYLTGCMSGSKFVPGAASPMSSYKQGKTVLVVPGCLKHLGQENTKSTWRQAEDGKGGRVLLQRHR